METRDVLGGGNKRAQARVGLGESPGNGHCYFIGFRAKVLDKPDHCRLDELRGTSGAALCDRAFDSLL